MQADDEIGKIAVMVDKQTFQKLEEIAKTNNLRTYGEAVKKLVEMI